MVPTKQNLKADRRLPMKNDNIPNQLPSVERFLQRVRSAERSNQKEIRISIQEARELTQDLAIFSSKLGKVISDINQHLAELTKNQNTVEIKMDGGNL